VSRVRDGSSRARIERIARLVVLLALAPSIASGVETAAKRAAPAPLTEAELLAIMMQVVQGIDDAIRGRELDMIHNEDALVRIPYAELQKDGHAATIARFPEFRTALIAFVSSILGLHTAADAADQALLEQRFPKVVESFDRLKSFFPAKTVAAARKLADRYMCPMHPDVVGKRGGVCPKCGMTLDQPVRVLPRDGATSDPTIRVTARTDAPLTVGRPTRTSLVLKRSDGSPVAPNDLIEVHTQKIHLLVIDRTLTDYHHEHPVPTAVPGEYAFTFTPSRAGPYRVWADLRSYPVGLQEYAMADLPASSDADVPMDETTATRADVGALRFQLIVPPSKIVAGRPTRVRLHVTRRDGTPCTDLEPLMQAFAHLVGFNEDHVTVLHSHPRGAPVVDPGRRGGPDLEFLIDTLRPGFYRLFAQVQVGGEVTTAPFGVKVLPAGR
jgi:hypothetical protein